LDVPDSAEGSAAAETMAEGIDPQDLDMFISHAVRKGPDEAERWFHKNFGGERAQAMRRAYDAEARRLRELRDPPSLDGEADAPWYLGPEPGDRSWPAVELLLSLDPPPAGALDVRP
jgi:hypothetical protein